MVCGGHTKRCLGTTWFIEGFTLTDVMALILSRRVSSLWFDNNSNSQFYVSVYTYNCLHRLKTIPYI